VKRFGVAAVLALVVALPAAAATKQYSSKAYVAKLRAFLRRAGYLR